jgi:hypothetical protein
MKRIGTIAAAILIAATFAGTAMAGGSSSGDALINRYNTQRDAIRVAASSGVISEATATELYREQRMFRMQLEQYAQGGLRPDEQMMLESRLNSIQATIDAWADVATVKNRLAPPSIATMDE